MNIIGDHGVIIASSELARIGTYHPRGHESVEQERVVRVETLISGCTMLPGVNAPLKVNGKVCRAVGITGEASKVEKFTQLVALNAQLLIEREGELHSAQRRQAQVRDLIAGLTIGQYVGSQARERLLELQIFPLWRLNAQIEPTPLKDGQVPHAESLWTELFGVHWQVTGRMCVGEAKVQGRGFACAITRYPEVWCWLG